MTTRLIIARHGNTFAPGDQVTRVGVTDLPLVESGLLQGRALGNYLNEHQLIPDVIFTSQLQRTQQTAEQAQISMGTHLPLHALTIFNEIDYGPDENQPEEQVLARIGEDGLKAWETQAIVPKGWNVHPQVLINNWFHFAETLRQEYANKTCLVVTSNGTARFAPYLTGDFAAFSESHRIKLATGAFGVFTHEHSSVWECVTWNIKP